MGKWLVYVTPYDPNSALPEENIMRSLTVCVKDIINFVDENKACPAAKPIKNYIVAHLLITVHSESDHYGDTYIFNAQISTPPPRRCLLIPSLRHVFFHDRKNK